MSAQSPEAAPIKHPPPVRRFLRYVRPYAWLLVGATLAGVLKFTLPAAFAIALRYMTDRLVPRAGAAVQPTDPVFSATERYLAWVASHLPAGWHASTPWGHVQHPGGDAAGGVRRVGRVDVLPQLLGAARRPSRHARSAHRPVPARSAPEPLVLPGAPVGRHRLAPDRRHRAGAELRRRRHDQHLDGRGGLRVLRGAAVLHGRAAHAGLAARVPALHPVHAHVRCGVQAHVQASAGSDGGVLRRSAGARCRLRAGQELRQRAARGARLLRQRAQPLRPGHGQRAHHQPVQHAGAVADRDGHARADLVRRLPHLQRREHASAR